MALLGEHGGPAAQPVVRCGPGEHGGPLVYIDTDPVVFALLARSTWDAIIGAAGEPDGPTEALLDSAFGEDVVAHQIYRAHLDEVGPALRDFAAVNDFMAAHNRSKTPPGAGPYGGDYDQHYTEEMVAHGGCHRLYLSLSKIPVKMADAGFRFRWRIREPHVCPDRSVSDLEKRGRSNLVLPVGCFARFVFQPTMRVTPIGSCLGCGGD